MNTSIVTPEHRFRDGPSIQHRWVATREIMATKRFIPYVESEDFHKGWESILSNGSTSSGVERLLHIDLLVRVSGFVKKLRPETERALQSMLSAPLPSLEIVASSADLPEGAKSAEIRENIAIALRYASGGWIDDYLIESLANEDRSQRCRIRLVDCLAQRVPRIDTWMERLANQGSLRNLQIELNPNSAAKRISEISLALAQGVRQNRNKLEMREETGLKLANFAGSLLRLRKGERLPTRLASASMGVAILLDELLSVDLSLIDEPSMYASLPVIRSWWQNIPYPRELSEALEPIISKLDTAMVIRARAGQKSNALVGHLTSASGGRRNATKRLVDIAERQDGLLPEIDDWLRGRERSHSPTDSVVAASLQGVADFSILKQFADVLLLARELEKQLELGCIGSDEAVKVISRELTAQARKHRIEIFLAAGTTVDFRGELHVSKDGSIPTETRVRVVRGGVLRHRLDGGYDVLVKAVVE